MPSNNLAINCQLIAMYIIHRIYISYNNSIKYKTMEEGDEDKLSNKVEGIDVNNNL